jgi:hypothetical protein
MTNSIRPVVVASLLVNGEAQDARVPRGMWTVRRPCHAVSPGEKPNQTPGTATGGWRRNDWKVQQIKQGDLTGTRTRHSGTRWHSGDGHNQTGLAGGPRRDQPESARKHEQTGANPEPTRPAGVRASIVAMKPGNAGGAKGRRKVDDDRDRHQPTTQTSVLPD